MKTTCKTNDLHAAPKTLQRFAFMQDETGLVPLTPGQSYEVYGIQQNRFGRFFFVVRDGETLPWWMPDALFSSMTEAAPDHWKTETYPSAYGGDATVIAPEIYFKNEDEIEDGTKQGHKAFAQMRDSV